MDKEETVAEAVVETPAYRKRISSEEWFAISRALEEHHAVFYKVWQMGKPHFTDEIETAAVQFDEKGEFIWFHFNPKFWDRMNFYNKLFVICHESLHVILNHGIRTKDAGVNSRACNAALDVVVNHTLVNNMGFDRSKIFDADDYCWVDTVFKGRKPLPPEDEMYETYFNLFEKVYGMGGAGDGEDGPSPLDDHSMLGEKSASWDKVIDSLSKGMTEEEKESLKQMVEKHFQKEAKSKKSENQPAGAGTGGQWVFAGTAKVKKKKKWETVIKNWSKKHLRTKDRDVEQWARQHRRLVFMPTDMFIPSDMETDDDREKTKIRVYFFLDTSGSCWGLKDRFFDAASSLPTERFDVRLFCFDTKVEETTLASRKIYGGGGTSFSILEQHVQGIMQKENVPYPEAVFVITDGYGDNIKPQMPHRWHWFITEGGTRNYIDRDCLMFNLKDYE